jgi:hypothetical protein
MMTVRSKVGCKSAGGKRAIPPQIVAEFDALG